MARLFKDITETIGNTPLVRINRIIQSVAEVYAKERSDPDSICNGSLRSL